MHREKAVALGNAEVRKTPAKDANEQDRETLTMHQANAAVMLLRMDAAKNVWPLLKYSSDPRVRSYIIHWLSPRGGRTAADYHSLRTRNRCHDQASFTANQLRVVSSKRRNPLLAGGEFVRACLWTASPNIPY